MVENNAQDLTETLNVYNRHTKKGGTETSFCTHMCELGIVLEGINVSSSKLNYMHGRPFVEK